MKELEFRVWDEDSQEMVEGGVGIDINGVAYVENPFDDHDFTYYPGCPIMQYTNYKDRDGVKVFDGDIIRKANGLRFRVYWVKNNYRSGWSINTAGKAKVIGNIYENANLLKVAIHA